jgi:hypothetical protein
MTTTWEAYLAWVLEPATTEPEPTVSPTPEPTVSPTRYAQLMKPLWDAHSRAYREDCQRADAGLEPLGHWL